MSNIVKKIFKTSGAESLGGKGLGERDPGCARVLLSPMI